MSGKIMLSRGKVYDINIDTGPIAANFNADDLPDGPSGTKVIMTGTERTKLAGVEAGATNDQTGAEIKGLVEALAEGSKLAATAINAGVFDASGAAAAAQSAAQSYADALTQDDVASGTTYKQFSATEQTKLSGIEAGATNDQTGAEMKAAIEALTEGSKLAASALNTDALTQYQLLAGRLGNLYPVNRHPNLTRTSTTRMALTAPGANFLGEQYVVVNGLYVDLSTAKTVDTSGASVVHTIASDGTDSTENPAVSTLYHVYLSNASASYAASSVRLSATAPTTGYLATSGNGRNWRHVGAVYLDGSAQIAADYNLAGYYPSVVTVPLASQIDRTSGSAGLYDIISLPNVVILPGLATLVSLVTQVTDSILAQLAQQVTDSSLAVLLKHVPTQTTDVANQATLSLTYTTVQNITCKNQYYYTSNNCTVYTTSQLTLSRNPLI